MMQAPLTTAADRLQGTGSYALDLADVSRHFGALVALSGDVALRVSGYVSMMHNGKVFKEGTPAEIKADPEVQQIYLGGKHG